MIEEKDIAMLVAIDKEDEGNCDVKVVFKGLEKGAYEKKAELMALNSAFQTLVSEVIARNPFKPASEVDIRTVLQYNKYIHDTQDKINKELNELVAPPYYNHHLTVLT